MVEATPVEDLSREHGLLRRLLIIYKSISRRMGYLYVSPELYAAAGETAEIAKRFIEDYHQFLEETYVFPRLERSKEFSWLINSLKKQHKAAECATNEILALAARPSSAANRQLSHLLDSYAAVYEPHAAREDTVVFPTFAKKIESAEYSELGERFGEIEAQRFGRDGFEKMLGKISEIEKSLGIYDLCGFTLRCVTR